MAYETYEKKLDGKLVASIVATGMLSFCGVLVETAMNIAFPTIMSEFDVNSATVQWITTGYLLMLGIIMPMSAYLNRRFTMRSLFVAAIALFTVGTVAGALAPNFAVLLIARLIQGAGTGIASPLMFNIVYEQVPDENLGTMSGVATFTTSVAPAIGPSVGGILVTAFGWRSIFWVLVPVVVIAAVIGILSIRESHETERPRFDVVGEVLIAIFAVTLLVGVSSTDSGLLVVGVLLAAAVVSIVAYAFHAKRCDYALVDMSVFGHSAFTFAVLSIVLGQMITLGINYLLPNYMQVSLEASAALAGNLMIPGCLLMSATVPVSGILYDKYGVKPVVTVGAVALLAACLGFGLIGTIGSLAVLVVFHIVSAMGQAAVSVNVRTHGMKALPQRLEGDGNAAVNTVQQLAGGLGTAICSSIVSAAQSGATDVAAATATGTGIAFWVMAACAVGLLACSLLSIRSRD